MELPFAESWKIKMVEPIHKSTREEREQWLKEAHYNVFQLKSDQVFIDCITDSGTGAMTDRQWAALMMGDESYAGARSFFKMKDMITKLTGFDFVIPTHQGRAAENVLFSALVKQGDIVPGNSHFDTTKGHIESRKATAVDCTIDEAKNTQLEHPFKGSVDINKLEKVLETAKNEKVSCSLAMIDIDDFKKVNDTYGHSAGDTVLIALADILKSCCREGDYACRYGGEEFALILCGKTLTESETILESVLICFSKMHFPFTKKSLTFSCGIAKLLYDDTKDTVFKRADQHLYVSKNNGKNQITMDGEL